MMFSDMTNPASRLLYSTMWGGNGFSAFESVVQKTVYNGKVSSNSFSFRIDTNNGEEDALIKIFGLSSPALFRTKFLQSCKGSGLERSRIIRLNSSALCPLLFFYNVTENHPMELVINGEKFRFFYSEFEYKNPVTKWGEPSNVDVVLVGESLETKESIVLFLESKLFEYYYDVTLHEETSSKYLSDSYGKRIYTESNMAQLGYKLNANSKAAMFTVSADSPCYLKGLKQMISHFIGVMNRLNCCDTSGLVCERIKAGARVYLGSIVFDERIGKLKLSGNRDCFSDYSRRYAELADLLNQNVFDPSRFVVLRELLCYSYFKESLFVEDKIREFYFNCGI